jgi:membrane-associated phospholipid phosphatase
MWHYSELMTLRSGEPFQFLVTKSEGLVTFPSFHTALGLIIVYALRGMIWLAIPVAVVNALMTVGTLPEGGHHLSDVIGGAAIGLISIATIRAVLSYERGNPSVGGVKPMSRA